MSISNFLQLSGVKYGIQTKGVTRGLAKPFPPRFAVGSQAFTGGTPPFTVQGQKTWDGGFQQKYSKFDDNRGIRSSFSVDLQYHDRIRLDRSFSATIYDTTKTGPVKLAGQPFGDLMFAYDTASKSAWYKSGSSAWAAVSLPVFSGTDATGFLSDCIGAYYVGTPAVLTPYLLLGTDKGHICKISVSGGTPTATEADRPAGSGSGENLQGGIYAMSMYAQTLFLGGQRSDGSGAILAWGNSQKSTTLVTIQKFGAGDLSGSATVRTMLTRYVANDQDPLQLHFTADRTSNGNEGWHFMFNGTGGPQTLRKFADNYPLCAIEYDVIGARGLLFGMADFGEVVRYTGDYESLLRIDTPDIAYRNGVRALVQYGRLIAAPILDATNGLSVLWYDGRQWYQGAVTSSSNTGEGSGLGVYKNTLFVVHKATSHGKIYELNAATSYQTSGKVVTALMDGDFREVPKEWLRARVQHAPLAASESIQIEYLLDDAAADLAFAEPFDATSYEDTTNTTAIWDTTNGYATVAGNAEKNFVGINTASTTHIATKHQHASPTSLTPGQIVAAGTEASSANYDGIEADDSATWATGSTAGTLDQSQTSSNDEATISSGNWRGQTFQAGASATLSAVILKLWKGNSNTHTGCVRLYASSGGLPTGAVLATSDTATISSTTTPGAEVTFSFATPYTLTSGTTYVLVYQPLTGGAHTIRLNTAGGYASGTFVSSNDSGVSWTATAGYDLYFKTYTGGTFGQAVQLFRFYLSELTLNTLLPRAICTSASGFTLSIWNAATLAWETVTSTALSTEVTATGTISTSVASYRDGSGYVYLMLTSSVTGTNATASLLTTDFVRLDASYTTALKTARSTTVDQAAGTIATATATFTTNSSGTYVYYMSVDAGVTWESVTSGVQKTFATTGSALRWRADITAASATAQPQLQTVTIAYTASTYVSLGTNSTVGLALTEFDFGDAIYSKLISLRLTLVGPGTTTPTIYSWAVEYLVSPDTKQVFRCTLDLREGFEYEPDGGSDTRTPAAQYDALLALRTSRQKPTLIWVDGTTTTVTFEVGDWAYNQKAVGSSGTDEEARWVPLSFIEV